MECCSILLLFPQELHFYWLIQYMYMYKYIELQRNGGSGSTHIRWSEAYQKEMIEDVKIGINVFENQYRQLAQSDLLNGVKTLKKNQIKTMRLLFEIKISCLLLPCRSTSGWGNLGCPKAWLSDWILQYSHSKGPSNVRSRRQGRPLYPLPQIPIWSENRNLSQ